MRFSETLYNSCLDDTKRTTITRWRLSSHRLKVETGRYTRPITARENRLCDVCRVVEDEYHAIYDCSVHRLIREKYRNILNFEDVNLQSLLNPSSVIEANNLGKFLNEIDENVKELEKKWVDYELLSGLREGEGEEGKISEEEGEEGWFGKGSGGIESEMNWKCFLVDCKEFYFVKW